MHKQYRLKLDYAHGTAQEFKDIVTYTACLNLYLRNVHTTQSSASIIQFESSADLTYGLLYLSNDDMFTVRVL